jgi:hypothetical protein
VACGGRDGQDAGVSSYANFFLGSTGVAGALTGLLDTPIVRVRQTRDTGRGARRAG